MSDRDNDKKIRERSPGYPGIGLETALKRAKELYSKVGRNESYTETIIVDHWGYGNSKSGAGNITLAALIKYGLLMDKGKGPERKARLTDLALDIILDEWEDSSEKQKLIQKAATKPEIFSEIFSSFSEGLPNEKDLLFYLEREKKFAKKGAKKFRSIFYSTIDYANLTDNYTEIDEVNTIPVEDKNKLIRENADKSSFPRADARNNFKKTHDTQEIQLPLSNDKWAVLTASFPLSAEEWEQMINILNVMKPSLTEGHRTKDYSQTTDICEDISKHGEKGGDNND